MTSIVMRILSILPIFTAGLCAIILLGSLIGIPVPEQQQKVPLIPCGIPGFETCPVGMAEDNLSIPWGMVLLDLDADVQWERGDVAWVGIVDAKWAEEGQCPPDDNGLTDCESNDFEYLAGGPDSEDSFQHSLSPGDSRFVTGGKEGSLDLSSQNVTVLITISLSIWVEILLLLAIVGLGASALDMNFPIVSNLFKREKGE
jgi:hypothetical protein